MLNLRYPKPGAAPQPKPDAPAPASNAEKARALIALLEAKDSGSGAKDVPPEHLRDWARDLIRTVEAKRSERAVTPEPKPATAPVSLFSKAAPRLTPAAPPPVQQPPARPTPQAGIHDVPSEFVSTVTDNQAPQGRASAAPDTRLPRKDLRKLIDGAFDPATMAREHPAIIAMTLVGKPSIEQAAALRSLPSGQVRAVHKALRQMQAGA